MRFFVCLCDPDHDRNPDSGTLSVFARWQHYTRRMSQISDRLLLLPTVVLLIVGLIAAIEAWTHCSPWWTKKRHFILYHNSHVSTWIFTILLPVETGINAR